MNPFLSSGEIAQMRKDFANVLSSAQGTPITILYRSGISGATWDKTYQQWVGGSRTYATIDVGALQQFIDDPDKDKDLLEFAFVQRGDCVFSILSSVNLDGKDEVTVVDPNGVLWTPITVPTRAFYEYIDVRVGSTQIAQSILARREQIGEGEFEESPPSTPSGAVIRRFTETRSSVSESSFLSNVILFLLSNRVLIKRHL